MAVLGYGADLIVAEAGRVGGVVLVAGKAVGGAVKEIEAIVGADPEAAGPVLVEGEDAGAGERVGVGGIVEIADKAVGRIDVEVEAIFCADPEVAAAVGEEDVNPGIADRGLVAFDRYIDGKMITIEFVEAGFGAEPEEAEAVAGDGQDGVLREPLLDGQGAEEKMRAELGGEREWESEEGEEEEECEQGKSNGEEREWRAGRAGRVQRV